MTWLFQGQEFHALAFYRRSKFVISVIRSDDGDFGRWKIVEYTWAVEALTSRKQNILHKKEPSDFLATLFVLQIK
jgi:hypothetical protein